MNDGMIVTVITGSLPFKMISVMSLSFIPITFCPFTWKYSYVERQIKKKKKKKGGRRKRNLVKLSIYLEQLMIY